MARSSVPVLAELAPELGSDVTVCLDGPPRADARAAAKWSRR